MRAHRSRLVPLYSKLGRIVRQIGHAEGAIMVEGGHAARMVRKIDGRYMLAGFQLRELLTEDRSSPCMITARETAIYAGTERVARGVEMQVRAKIDCWPDARNLQHRETWA